jgi:hypothetical protein
MFEEYKLSRPFHTEEQHHDSPFACQPLICLRWMIEAAAPNAILRRGFNQDSLPIGTETLIEGCQAKDDANRAN